MLFLRGIRRSEMIIGSADLALYLVDATIGLTRDDNERVQRIQKTTKTVIVINKVDLAAASSAATSARGFELEVPSWRRLQ